MDEISKNDTQFVNRAMARLPQAQVSPRLTDAMLAAFDEVQASQQAGVWAVLGAGIRRLGDTVWPGAPLWAPASAFAAALVAGVSLGAVVPAMGDTRTYFSLDEPASFNLVTPDMARDL